jgi:hypothetical protein
LQLAIFGNVVVVTDGHFRDSEYERLVGMHSALRNGRCGKDMGALATPHAKSF